MALKKDTNHSDENVVMVVSFLFQTPFCCVMNVTNTYLVTSSLVSYIGDHSTITYDKGVARWFRKCQFSFSLFAENVCT